jgi:Tfp pilus assembly protein PilF
MTPQQLFHSAVGLQQQGRLAEAETLYRQVLAEAPGAVDAWINRGAALQGLGRLQEALACYDQAVTRGPSHASAWANRAQVFLALNQPAPALENFDSVVKLLPQHAGAWRGRASALFALKRSEEALHSLDRALAIAPADLDTQYRRAAILHVEQRFDEALAALDAILAAHSDHSDALTLKSALLCETGRAADGMACYRHHAEIHFGALPVTQPADPDFKKTHDAEQRTWMGAHGIAANGFHLETGARTAGPAVNPANADSVARRWAESDPQIVVIDDLLTPDALAGLRRFAWGSTMWRRPYPHGYLGAVPEQGFACPLLAQIAEELRSVFPSVMGNNGLGLMWGFKYDSHLNNQRSAGIPIHADQAKVNVNFWIAPDDANRDTNSGGLVVWDVKPPLDWDFARYNGNEAAIRAFLTESGAKPITVPHRANRAVIFDSDLFHATDRIDFQEGYENRRINVTMLYGRRTFRGA